YRPDLPARPTGQIYRLAARRERCTASGEKTARMNKTQANACHRWSGEGWPVHSQRSSFTTIVNGLTSANCRSGVGSESLGTKAEEMNVSGKTAMKPTELAASGVLTSRPRNANTHENE